MRKLNLVALFALLFILASCSSTPSVVVRPSVEFVSTATIGIDTVELTPTATIVSIKAKFRPKQWIRMDSATFIRVGDEKFAVDSSQNMALSTKFFMPESGEHSFKLFFPALPKGSKSFDFMESESVAGAFNLYGVDLTGKAKYGVAAKGIPSSLRKATLDESIPTPQFDVAPTTLKVHIIGYRETFNIEKLNLSYNSHLYTDSQEAEAKIDSDGTAIFHLTLQGPTRIWLTFDNTNRSVAQGTLFAGEDAEIYLDLREWTRQYALLHSDEPSTTPSVYFTGGNATLNGADELFRTLRSSDESLQFNPYGNDDELSAKLLDMSVAEYFEHTIADADRVIASIEESTLPTAAKEFGKIETSVYALLKLFTYQGEYISSYRKVHNIPWSERELDYTPPTATKEDFALLKRYNINDPRNLYCSNGRWLYHLAIQKHPEYITELTDDTSGLLFELNAQLYEILTAATNMNPITDEQQAYLDAMDNQFYNEAIKSLQAIQQEKIAAARAKGGYTVCETPNVAKERLFDAIAAKYKGKVVMVDFWATWCGPCVASMKAMEPIKEKELLDNENIAFVYISSESSPRAKWETFISDIKGDHYYLTAEQWAYVSNKFGITGIPSYAIIQKDGKYSLRNDLRGGSDKMKDELLKQAAAN